MPVLADDDVVVHDDAVPHAQFGDRKVNKL
jgi:hypothetical protein